MITKATVDISVVLHLNSTWTEDAPLSQVFEQAKRQAESLIHQKLGMLVPITQVRVTAVMTDKVTAG